MRLGGPFHARALGELERKLGLLPWDTWLPAGGTLRVRATCHKSRLYHQKAIAERVLQAAGRPGAVAPAAEEEADEAAQLVVVRVHRDEVQVSLDSSGALLHRRGYRLATARAPLRESLAAALLLASGWDPATPLVDPLCGSGTIPIEGALLARGIAPGIGRAFAFRQWRAWQAGWWEALVADARAAERPAMAPIAGSDRDAGAIEAARANAARAGVAGDVVFEARALSHLAPQAGPGWLVSNPPYGVRVGDRRALRDLFARLGQLARERVPGFGVALLLPAAPLERATGLSFQPLFRTRNGGLPVRAVATRPAS